jgi:hypothetical protein
MKSSQLPGSIVGVGVADLSGGVVVDVAVRGKLTSVALSFPRVGDDDNGVSDWFTMFEQEQMSIMRMIKFVTRKLWVLDLNRVDKLSNIENWLINSCTPIPKSFSITSDLLKSDQKLQT